jgi:hypothetical protein
MVEARQKRLDTVKAGFEALLEGHYREDTIAQEKFV